MTIHFEKYQGTGNDFIMIDNRELNFNPMELDVPKLCDRRFGIGADGLIVIQRHDDLDFDMIYFNSDGSQSFCGNGSRCAVSFARSLGMIGQTTRFLSTDGEHEANFIDQDLVRLKMHDVLSHDFVGGDYVIDTGSPHYIVFVDDVEAVDLLAEAHRIRYSEQYARYGINVNFVHSREDGIDIRTYERGVENETLSCGTGVTAAAIAHYLHSGLSAPKASIPVSSRGGQLRVEFEFVDETFRNIHLIGPAEKSFEGSVEHG